MTLPNSTLAMPGASQVTVVREPRPQKALSPKNAFRSWWSIWEAAERSDYRGWFYLPTLNPREQLNSLSLSAMRERTDFLYKNVGAVTMLIDGLAIEEAGTGSWPKWISSNPEFNKAITDTFHYAYHDPRVFSADGEHDYYGAQVAIRKIIRLYGDGAGQMLRPGPGSILPQFALYGGWRIDSGKGQDAKDGWREGLQRSAAGRLLNVNVINSVGVFGGSGDDQSIVPADDILFLHGSFLPGQNRGIPILAPVIKRMFRREDIHKALVNGTLARERLGFAIEFKDDDTAGPTIGEGEGDEQVMTNRDGSEFTLRRFFGADAGEEIEVPRLPNGATIKTLESNRPGTAVTEFLDSILREAAWCSLYPPEYIYFLGGMGQGTVARLVMQRVQKLIRFHRANQMFPQFCNRWNVFAAWQMIKAGMFDKVGVPDDWWKHKIHSDADQSVDVAREGRLYDDRVATGKMSIPAYHALSGDDDDEVENENLEVTKRRIAKLNVLNSDPELVKAGIQFKYYDIWPRSSNQPTTPETPAEEEPGQRKPKPPE